MSILAYVIVFKMETSLPIFNLMKHTCFRAMSSVKATNDEEAAARVAAVDADTGAPTVY